MGSPINPLIANLYMEEFEVKALSTAPYPARLWLRFVDIYVIQKAEFSQLLLQHINTQDPHKWLMVEEPSTTDGSLPFLDTQVVPGPNNTPITTVYRKPTHTDQYLCWDSNHYIGAKHSVYNTLAHRAKIVSHNKGALQKELQHIRNALQACQLPNWTLNRLQQKLNRITRDTQPTTHNNNGNNNTTNNRNISIVICYIHRLGESLKSHAETRECRYTSRQQTLSKYYFWPLRIRTINYRKVA